MTGILTPARIDRVMNANACLVALAGFATAPSAQALGVFERCGIAHVTLPTVDATCRYLEKVVPDAVVIDTHSPTFGRAKAPVVRLLKAVGKANRPPAIVVLNSSHLTHSAKQLYWQANATFVPLPQQTHRYLAGLVRKLAGFPGCCEPKSFPR